MSSLLLTSGCEEKPLPVFDFAEIQACHRQNNFDEAAIRNQLTGTWTWAYVYQIGRATGPVGSYTEYTGMVLSFLPDSTGMYTAPDGSTLAFTWDIAESSGNYYTIQTNVFVPQIHGALWFCDGVMICNAAIFGGEDTYFVKE
ncbi:MAG: hypothetical protein SF053_14580 [Bacteroidia bacterium]|nr:hypothetical protein [Bacteroidia bacterium]